MVVQSFMYLVGIFLGCVFPDLAIVATSRIEIHIKDSRKLAFSNSDMVNIWAMIERNYFWIQKRTAQSHAVYAIL